MYVINVYKITELDTWIYLSIVTNQELLGKLYYTFIWIFLRLSLIDFNLLPFTFKKNNAYYMCTWVNMCQYIKSIYKKIVFAGSATSAQIAECSFFQQISEWNENKTQIISFGNQNTYVFYILLLKHLYYLCYTKWAAFILKAFNGAEVLKLKGNIYRFEVYCLIFFLLIGPSSALWCQPEGQGGGSLLRRQIGVPLHNLVTRDK